MESSDIRVIESPSMFGFNVKCKIINGVKYVDWDSSNSWLPSSFTSGTMLLVPKYPDKLERIQWPGFYDRTNQIHFKIFSGTLDKDKQPRIEKIYIRHQLEFDLTKISDRAKAFLLANSAYVRKSPFFDAVNPNFEGNEVFKIESIEEQAQTNIKKRAQGKSALDIIGEMSKNPAELKDFARTLLTIREIDSQAVVLDKIEEFAITHPEKVISAFNNSSRKLSELVSKAISVNILLFLPESGYAFKGQHLGYTVEDVIHFLKGSGQMQMTLHKEVAEQMLTMTNTLPKDQKERLESIVKVDKMDRSMSDHEAVKAIRNDNPAFDVNEFMKMLDQKLSENLNPINQRVQKLAQQINEHKEAAEVINNEIQQNTEGEDGSDDELYQKLADKNSNDLLDGKTIDQYTIVQLREFIKTNFESNDYKSFIVKDKQTLFTETQKLFLNKMDEGTVILS